MSNIKMNNRSMCVKKRIRKIRKELAATYTYLFHYYSFRKFISRRSVGSRVVLVIIKSQYFWND